MTGSALQAMDVVLGLLLGEKIKKGGSLREGGSKIGPDGRLADDGKRFHSAGRFISMPEAAFPPSIIIYLYLYL